MLDICDANTRREIGGFHASNYEIFSRFLLALSFIGTIITMMIKALTRRDGNKYDAYYVLAMNRDDWPSAAAASVGRMSELLLLSANPAVDADI